MATGTAEDAERLVDFGARQVIDYTSRPVAEQVRAAYPDGVDALIDLVSYTPDGLPLDAVRKGGAVASSMGAAQDETLAGFGLTRSNIMAGPVREVVAALAEQASAGALRVHVATRLRLEQATEGLATIAAGQAHGKIVVTIAD